MSVPFSLVHSEEFLNQLNSEIRYGFKTWFLHVNQTYTKSVTWWNRVSHFVVNQINIITTEHNMLVVRHRVSCSWPHMHYEAKDDLEVLVLLLPPPEYWWQACASIPSLCGAGNGVWGVLCVLYGVSHISAWAFTILFNTVETSSLHFSSVFPHWVQCHGKTTEHIMNSFVSQLDSSQRFLPKYTRVTIFIPLDILKW